MRCSTCQAVVTQDNVILSKGQWSQLKHYNRVCKYDLERKKDCANPCRISEQSLTWEAEANLLDQELLRLSSYIEKEI